MTPRALAPATPTTWHALAMLAAAALAWLVFTAYRQPEFILDFAAMRLC